MNCQSLLTVRLRTTKKIKMKIILKLNPETALIVAATIEAVYNSKALTRREKSTLSIALDVATKIDGKAVVIKAKQNLFDAKKKN